MAGSDRGHISPYAAPARAEDLSALPPAYLCVGEMDLVRDENIQYAVRLMQAGVSTVSMFIQVLFMALRYWLQARRSVNMHWLSM